MVERMLIIDDEILVLESCRKIFSAEAFEVVITPSPREGLKLAADSAFDVILCDWSMPDFDGMDVIEELGPTGSFLDHAHTLRHYREPFYSQLADKKQYSLWLEQGGTTMEARAAEMVDSILAEHQPDPLPEDVQGAIKKIVQREQAWIESIDPD